MVYVYVCKRFKVSMEMVSGKDSEWILSLVKFYLKHRRKEMQKLERAEVNPKRRATTCSYDSSADVFKINVVYKDQKGVDQEVKWIIKECSIGYFCLILKVLKVLEFDHIHLLFTDHVQKSL